MKTSSLKTPSPRMQGFTLIELIMVIVITGIIGGMVAIFIKKPVDAYFDSGRRAALTDVADTAARRMSRDIRKALPNSIRTPTNQCIEFIPTKTGGRYRAETYPDPMNPPAQLGDILDFTTADSSFNFFTPDNSSLPLDQKIKADDIIAIYNLGIPGSTAYDPIYATNNIAVVDSITTDTTITPNEQKITLKAAKKFPLESGSNRFHVVPSNENVVAYVCNGDKLYRTTRAFLDTSSCTPRTDPTLPPLDSILANNVSACHFVYNDSDLQRNALVQLTVKFTDNDETVSLYHEVHVNNTP